MIYKLFITMFFIMIVLNFIWVFAMLHYCKTIKNQFPRIYHLLGNPPSSIQELNGQSRSFYSSSGVMTTVSLSTIQAMFLSICFLVRQRYKKINNPMFIKHSRILRAYFFLTVFGMLNVLGWFIALVCIQPS